MKECDCKTKYCKHYESDFDRFVKENPTNVRENRTVEDCEMKGRMCACASGTPCRHKHDAHCRASIGYVCSCTSNKLHEKQYEQS
jgi:hypothetical protein